MSLYCHRSSVVTKSQHTGGGQGDGPSSLWALAPTTENTEAEDPFAEHQFCDSLVSAEVAVAFEEEGEDENTTYPHSIGERNTNHMVI